MQQVHICTSLTGNIKFYAQVVDIPLAIFVGSDSSSSVAKFIVPDRGDKVDSGAGWEH